MEISFTIAESSQENNAPEFKDNHTFVYRRVPFLNVQSPFMRLKTLFLKKFLEYTFEGDSPFEREGNHTSKS